MANKTIEINGVRWRWDDRIGRPNDAENTGYIYDYYKVVDKIESKKIDALSQLRYLIPKDIWFVTYFIIKNELANHPFVVQACRDVQFGPRTKTVDLWARGHLKTTIISVAETIQDIVSNPEERIAIFSYNQRAARKIFRMVKYILESSDLLKACFPDVLWQNPEKEAPNWSEETGLIVRRKGNYREPTLSAHGLLDGMPTGDHFTKRIYDDIVTEDIADSVVENEKLKEKFDLSYNLSTFQETDRIRVVGTPYNYFDALMYIQGKIDPIAETPLYHVRRKPATEDGTFSGPSVFVPESALAEARTNKRKFAAQQLLDPTPQDELRLDPNLMKDISPDRIPKNLWKFMCVDPAGLRTSDKREGDSWAILCFGIVPQRDDLGASDVYLLDLVIETLLADRALKEVSDMYCRNGRIWRLGVEKVGISTMEVHISNYLFAQGRVVNTNNGSLAILQPGGRSKEGRIQSNVGWALNNGKLHISTAIPTATRERLRMEMQKFPHWRDDGLDTLSYAFDLIKDFRFSKGPVPSELGAKKDAWDEAEEGQPIRGWMVQ